MSDKAKFKIKVGETEIELEGSEEKIIEQYKKVFEWASNQPSKTKLDSPTARKKEKAPIKQEGKKTGGNSPTLSPVIDKMVSEKFFEMPNTRTLDDIIEEIIRLGYPASGINNRKTVYSKMKRMQRAGKIKATQEENTWKYWTEA